MKKLVLSVLGLALVMTSCSDDDEAVVAEAIPNLTVNLIGLEDLGPDYKYEGWIIVDGAPVSTGIYNEFSASKGFVVNVDQLAKATKFVLSVEPTDDNDPAPSNTKVLAGDFSGNTASLNSGIIGDFTGAAGKFFLRTPTDEADGMNNGNDMNGVWFGTPATPPTPNFVLPVLPEGWVYEGWVVGDAGPLSTGTFTKFDEADKSGMFSGVNPGPPVPGEDFFMDAPDGETFPLDVRNRTVVISVEPYPDNAATPFSIKPLVGTSGMETAPTTHDFGANLDSLPTGTVTR